MNQWGFDTQLAQIKKRDLYRSRRVLESPQGAEVLVAGKSLVNFSSNDYLGLANHPQVIQAFKAASDKYGVGSGSADLICGHSVEHQALEEDLAVFTGRARALVFSTGYMANLGVISALVDKGDAIFHDRLNHASLLDAGKLSGARFRRYTHADMNRLEQLLRHSTSIKKLIVSDGVFSMDGDEAPIKSLVNLAAQSESLLMIDDAHGIGVLGASGAGLLDKYQLNQQQVPILMGTFGKALGTFGAFIAGSETLIETLIQQARTYIYTTSAPAALMAATRESLRLVQQEPWRREKIAELVNRFQQGVNRIGLDIQASNTSIQPVVLGGSAKALRVSEQLKEQGYLVGAIREPTVPKGSARLRITITAAHSANHIDGFLSALETSIRS